MTVYPGEVKPPSRWPHMISRPFRRRPVCGGRHGAGPGGREVPRRRAPASDAPGTFHLLNVARSKEVPGGPVKGRSPQAPQSWRSGGGTLVLARMGSDGRAGVGFLPPRASRSPALAFGPPDPFKGPSALVGAVQAFHNEPRARASSDSADSPRKAPRQCPPRYRYRGLLARLCNAPPRAVATCRCSAPFSAVDTTSGAAT